MKIRSDGANWLIDHIGLELFLTFYLFESQRANAAVSTVAASRVENVTQSNNVHGRYQPISSSDVKAPLGGCPSCCMQLKQATPRITRRRIYLCSDESKVWNSLAEKRLENPLVLIYCIELGGKLVKNALISNKNGFLTTLILFNLGLTVLNCR